MGDALVTSQYPAGFVYEITGGVRFSGVPTNESGIVAIRDETDILTVRLVGVQQPRLTGALPDGGLVELPHRQQQVRQLVAQMEQQEGENDLPSTASREILFMQLLLLLRKSSLQENLENSASRLNLLLAWLEDHFADEVNWDAVADQFSLSLRTLHRQLKQQTGLTPQRYLNRLRLMKARHLLRHSEASVTDIAYRCGFSDSNHFSTLFRREFNWSPRDIRQGRDGFLQ